MVVAVGYSLLYSFVLCLTFFDTEFDDVGHFLVVVLIHGYQLVLGEFPVVDLMSLVDLLKLSSVYFSGVSLHNCTSVLVVQEFVLVSFVC